MQLWPWVFTQVKGLGRLSDARMAHFLWQSWSRWSSGSPYICNQASQLPIYQVTNVTIEFVFHWKMRMSFFFEGSVNIAIAYSQHPLTQPNHVLHLIWRLTNHNHRLYSQHTSTQPNHVLRVICLHLTTSNNQISLGIPDPKFNEAPFFCGWLHASGNSVMKCKQTGQP